MSLSSTRPLLLLCFYWIIFKLYVQRARSCSNHPSHPPYHSPSNKYYPLFTLLSFSPSRSMLLHFFSGERWLTFFLNQFPLSSPFISVMNTLWRYLQHFSFLSVQLWNKLKSFWVWGKKKNPRAWPPQTFRPPSSSPCVHCQFSSSPVSYFSLHISILKLHFSSKVTNGFIINLMTSQLLISFVLTLSMWASSFATQLLVGFHGMKMQCSLSFIVLPLQFLF